MSSVQYLLTKVDQVHERRERAGKLVDRRRRSWRVAKRAGL